MRRGLLAVVIVPLAAVALLAFQFDVAGTIRKIDAASGGLLVYVSGQDRSLKIDRDVKVLNTDGQPLTAGLNAKELKEGANVTMTLDMRPDGFVVTAIRLGTAGMLEARASVGLKPLTEMTADDGYKGEDGGLYGEGRNEPAAAHLKIARSEAAKIEPLDAAGMPTTDGAIGLVSISMSNATMEFSRFKELADRDPNRSPNVTIVDCAQNGQAMAQWVDPQGPAWIESDRRLAVAKVTRSRCRWHG